jgi:hypothetical protein
MFSNMAAKDNRIYDISSRGTWYFSCRAQSGNDRKPGGAYCRE